MAVNYQNTAMLTAKVQGALLAESGHNPGLGSRGLYWQTRVSIPVRVLGALLADRGQHPCKGPGGFTGRQGSASLYGSGGFYWQSESRVNIPVGIKGASLTVKGQHLHRGQAGITGSLTQGSTSM